MYGAFEKWCSTEIGTGRKRGDSVREKVEQRLGPRYELPTSDLLIASSAFCAMGKEFIAVVVIFEAYFEDRVSEGVGKVLSYLLRLFLVYVGDLMF